MARLLTGVGIPCGHESIFDWRGIRAALRKLKGEEEPELSHASTNYLKDGKWFEGEKWLSDKRSIVAESSYMAAPFLGESCLRDVPVIHVVRHPVKVANSFCNHIDYFQSHLPANNFERFIYKHLPELSQPMSVFDRTALFVVRWNEMIESHQPDIRHRVEDGPKPVFDFIQKFGEPFSDTKINSFAKWHEQPFEIHKIADRAIRQQFIDLGRRYGYKMTNMYLL